MKNYIKAGGSLSFVAPVGGVVSGGAYLIQALLVVAITSAEAGAEFEGQLVGVVELPKATGVSGAIGQKAYWDNTAKNITTTSSGNTLVGVFAKANVSADTVVAVLLDGVAR